MDHAGWRAYQRNPLLDGVTEGLADRREHSGPHDGVRRWVEIQAVIRLEMGGVASVR
jgi:hypothetical protein